MEFLYGLLTAVVFFIALLSFYYVGYKQGSKHTAKPPDRDPDEIERAKKEAKDFREVMSYTLEKALERKKVQ